MNYGKEAEFLRSILRQAYSVCFSKAEKSAVSESEFDLVTEADRSIEKYIRGKISESFPADRIIGEEFSPDEKAVGRFWAIDPIDGTFNMSRSIPIYAMQCGVFENGECVASAVFCPVTNELFSASAGDGAFLDGERIFAAKSTPLSKCILSFGDLRHDDPDTKKYQLTLTDKLHEKIAKIRMFGSAGLDLSWAAAGRTDGAVIFTRNIWDIGPGMLLCREAGAKIISADGGAYADGFRGIFVTANENVGDLFNNIVTGKE